MNFLNKKVIYVTGETIPSFKFNGSTLATISLCLKLKELGANLQVFTYEETLISSPSEIKDELINHDIHIEILKKNHHLHHGYFGEGHYQDHFNKFVQSFEPDYIFCYDWSAVALVAKTVTKANKISLTCDLRHLAIKERCINYFRKNKSFVSKLFNLKKSFFEYFRARNKQIQILDYFQLNISHANHHCEWLKSKGVDITYVPQFIKIPESSFYKNNSDKKLKIMLAGNLDGVISIRAFETLIYRIIPDLKKAIGDNFEVNYYGHYDQRNFTSSLRSALNDVSDFFVFNGFKPLKEALISHHIFLVPNNISLGFRTRIVEGMAYGACILAHKANTYGMPELTNGENILIAESPIDFVNKILDVYKDRSLMNNLRFNSYYTYENIYSVDITIDTLLKKIF